MSPMRRPETAFATPPRRQGTLGWLGSASVVALGVSGLAALAMTMPETGESMAETAAAIAIVLPPAAPSLGAMSEPAPETAPEPPAAAEAPDAAEAPPEMPQATDALPVPPDPAPPPPDPVAEALPEPETAVPPPPEPAELAVAEAQPAPEKPAEPAKPKAKPVQSFTRDPVPEEKPVEPPKEKPPEAAPAKKPAKKAPEKSEASVAAAPTQKAAAAESAGKGKAAAKSYGSEVMKKIRKTRKQKAPARGIAVVSFAIAANGGLASVGVARSSGSAELDAVAVDHIRRSAPFPAPPPGAQTKFSFEFVGK